MKKGILLLGLLLTLSYTGWGQVLVEDFDYTAGDNITSHGWTAHSGAGTQPITVNNGGLTYTGYFSSGIGNAALVDNTGEDDNKTFTAQSTGSVYVAFMVKVTTVAAGYFFHIGPNPIGTTFRGKVFMDATKHFGVSVGSNTGTMASTPFTLETTYFLVLKYEIVSGTNNDQVSLFIFDGSSSFPSSEPGTPTIGPLTDPSQSDVNPGSVALRQYLATQNFIVDGIRVATTWADAAKPSGPDPTLVVDPAILNGFNYVYNSGPSTSQSYNLSGSNLTGAPGNITVTGSTNYEVSNDNSNFGATALIAYSSSTLIATPVYVRLKAGLSGGVYNSESLSNAGGGATTQNVTCSGYVTTNYYSKSSGNLETTDSWGISTDGTGTPPSNFTADNQIFNIRNNATPSIGANWTVSGTNSKVILGNGTNSVNFIIPPSYSFSGTIDLSAASTLTIQNTTLPSFGTINSSSTVIYDESTTGQTITQTTYGNLTLSSASTKTFLGNTTTVTGDLVLNNTTLGAPGSAPFATISLGGNLTYQGTVASPADANSITLITTGTGIQTITGNGNLARFFRLQTTNSGNNVVLSETGGTTNLYVGNASGGGTNLANGTTLTLNGNTLTYFNGNGTFLGTGTLTCNTNSNVIINKNGATAFGTISLTTGSETLNNLTLIMSGGGNTATLGSNAIINGNLTITSGTLAITAGKQLSVNGTTDLGTAECLYIKSNASATGSFISIGAITGIGTAKVERYITGYSSANDGWHLLACPVNSFTIDGSTFEPVSGNDDLYWYDESQNLWMNWIAGSFNFGTDMGYLCGYKTTATKYFTGVLNDADKTISSVSYNASAGGGWHLIPNPFPCAILWSNTGWGATGYESTASAKILNGGTTYDDITNGNPIPAMNSFFLKVNSGTNSITIPVSARSHSTQAWYKNSDDPLLMLTVQSSENTTYQKNIIQFDDNATEGFDPSYDSPFLAGMAAAPRLFSYLDDDTKLSLNTFPALTGNRVVPLGFIKGSSAGYSINVTKLENFPNDVAISIEDAKTNTTQDLRLNPVYSFSSADGDNTKRFYIHIGAPNGINKIDKDSPLRIYASNNTLYISNNTGTIVKGDVFVYNLMGQQMMQQKLNEGALTKISLDAVTGYYLVKVITNQKAYSGKVFVQ